MRGWLVLLAGAAIACSGPESTSVRTSGGRTTGSGSGGNTSTGGLTGSGATGGTTGGGKGTGGTLTTGSGGAGGTLTTGSGGAGGSTAAGGTGGTGTGGAAGAGTGGAGTGGAGTGGAGTGGSTTTGGAGGAGGAAGAGTGGTGTGGSTTTGGTGGTGTGGSTTGGTGGTGAGGAAGSGGSTGGTAGTGSGGSTGTDAGGDPQQACTAMAEAYCAKLQECSMFVMSVAFGDQATCKARWILNCTPNFSGNGTSATPARTTACAQSIPALSCTTFLGGDLGSACAIAPGTVANGGPCGDDAQCASTFCARATDAVCGTCQPVTNAGDPCVQGSCSVSTNTVCPQGKTTCVRPKAGKIGDTCVGQEECDVGHQVGCNPTNSKCLALTLATSTCGANSLFPTSVAVCPKSGTCSSSLNGTCSPVGADGASCSTSDTGTHCLPPARCVGGRCTLPNPSTCR